MDKVNECYVFTRASTPAARAGRKTVNPAGTNSGSLKTYYFAHHGLDEDATSALLRALQDVLDTPDGDSREHPRVHGQ